MPKIKDDKLTEYIKTYNSFEKNTSQINNYIKNNKITEKDAEKLFTYVLKYIQHSKNKINMKEMCGNIFKVLIITDKHIDRIIGMLNKSLISKTMKVTSATRYKYTGRNKYMRRIGATITQRHLPSHIIHMTEEMILELMNNNKYIFAPHHIRGLISFKINLIKNVNIAIPSLCSLYTMTMITHNVNNIQTYIEKNKLTPTNDIYRYIINTYGIRDSKDHCSLDGVVHEMYDLMSYFIEKNIDIYEDIFKDIYEIFHDKIPYFNILNSSDILVSIFNPYADLYLTLEVIQKFVGLLIKNYKHKYNLKYILFNIREGSDAGTDASIIDYYIKTGLKINKESIHILFEGIKKENKRISLNFVNKLLEYNADITAEELNYFLSKNYIWEREPHIIKPLLIELYQHIKDKNIIDTHTLMEICTIHDYDIWKKYSNGIVLDSGCLEKAVLSAIYSQVRINNTNSGGFDIIYDILDNKVIPTKQTFKNLIKHGKVHIYDKKYKSETNNNILNILDKIVIAGYKIDSEDVAYACKCKVELPLNKYKIKIDEKLLFDVCFKNQFFPDGYKKLYNIEQAKMNLYEYFLTKDIKFIEHFLKDKKDLEVDIYCLINASRTHKKNKRSWRKDKIEYIINKGIKPTLECIVYCGDDYLREYMYQYMDA